MHENFEKIVDKFQNECYDAQVLMKRFRSQYGRVVELVDSLDSGSSVHCGRAGSSPASPTRMRSTVDVRSAVLFCVFWCEECVFGWYLPKYVISFTTWQLLVLGE